MNLHRICGGLTGALALATAVLLGAVPPCAADVPTPELRAFWVDGFNDGYKTPQQCDSLMERLRATHCNAVFVQVRKRGDAYYASHYEPWALDDPTHFDALAYVCQAAHASGKPYIQVHAWINACAVGGSHNPKGIAALHPEWYSISDNAADFDGESTKIDPGAPDAAEWTYRVYMDVVRHYPVDGIHFDFIRYGGEGKTAGHWGFNPISVHRYLKSVGLGGMASAVPPPVWNDSGWMQWRRNQVTALVRRVYLSAMAIRPKLIVSAATICWGDGPVADVDYETKSAAYTEVFADWRSWMHDGLLDLNCPMTYQRRPAYWAHWSRFVKDNQFGRQSAMGVGAWQNTIDGSMQQIVDTRTPTDAGHRAAGAVIFSYASTDTVDKVEKQYDEAFYTALGSAPVWTADAPVPAMPWKSTPTMGHVDGYALADGSLIPEDDATATLASRANHERRTATADGNGFFGFANLPAGLYDFVLRYNGRDVRDVIRVKAGLVTEISPGIPHRLVSGTGLLADGQQVTYNRAIVTNGSDRLGSYFYVADGLGKPAVKVEASNMILPTVMGDKVALTGTVRHEGGSVVIAEAVVRNIGAVLIP